MDKIIVMNDVLGLAGKSENFANFLTVSRKFGFTCVYIFHTIYPTRNNWQMILSQTKTFNIFPGSIQASSVIKIQLLTAVDTLTSTYRIENKLNKLCFNMSSSNKKQCLTIDIRDVNDLGPARFRIQAGKVCYYNQNKKDKTFNCFLDLIKQTSTADKIIFSITNLIDELKKKRYLF